MKEFKKVLFYAGLPVSMTAAMLCAAAIPLIKISKIMGHKYWQW